MNNDTAEQSHIEHSNPKEKSQEQQEVVMDNKTIITDKKHAVRDIKNICKKV